MWGTIGASGPPPQSSYTIDKGIPVNFTATLQAAAQHQSNFFVSSVSPGPHTLVITTLVDGAQYYLDYIQVTPPLPNANCPVFQALSSSSKSSIKPNSTSTALRSMIMPSQSESSTPSHGKMSITMGGILGITFGSAACAAVMVIVIYHLTIRRRQRKNEAYTGEPDFISASTSRTFILCFLDVISIVWRIFYFSIRVDFAAIRQRRNDAKAFPVHDRTWIGE